MRLADEGGIDALTMRRLGRELGVEAMALYHHFTNKDEVVDGIVDRVHDEIEVPTDAAGWMVAMRGRAFRREALSRHPWAAVLMEIATQPRLGVAAPPTRSSGCCGRRASPSCSRRTLSLLDSYIYGFAQQASLGIFEPGDAAAVAEDLLRDFPVDAYPHLAELAVKAGDETGLRLRGRVPGSGSI